MSYIDFKNAMLSVPKCKYFTTSGGKTIEDIDKSEKLLNVKFSRQNREFYEKFGYLSFCGNEIFGIDPNSSSGILEGNSVAYALDFRSKYNLPLSWIPIFNYQDGCLAYLDYSSLNTENEPQVIMAFYNGKEFEISDVLATDFGEFLNKLISEEL